VDHLDLDEHCLDTFIQLDENANPPDYDGMVPGDFVETLSLSLENENETG
jgi:hypothetical protein